MTIKQPIFRSDLATGIMNSLYDPSAMGQIYEAVGPDRMTQVLGTPTTSTTGINSGTICEKAEGASW